MIMSIFLNFFHTPYLQNSNPTNTLPDDETETESQDNDGELFSDDGINTNDESLGNDANTNDITYSSNDDNTVEHNSTSKSNHNIQNFNSEPVVQRRSGRVSNLPSKFFDFVLDDKVAAMNTKMEALNKNNTWVVTNLPPERKPIGCKWIYKIKYKSNEDIERYKARLVAKGYSQKEGVDYDETFSPMVKMVTIMCLISLAVNQGWTLFQVDVNNAFLYDSLTEEVYMTLPPGYFSANDTRICRLVKSLYGLKQAPGKWNEKLCTILLENGLKVITPCL
ncbi:putative RNA-directed DNA polymerase [Tanacetum coccineum]